MVPNECINEKQMAKPGFEDSNSINNNTVSYLRPVASREGKINVLSENLNQHLDRDQAEEDIIPQTNIEIKTEKQSKKNERYQGNNNVTNQKKKANINKNLDQSDNIDDSTIKRDTSVRNKSRKPHKKSSKVEKKTSKSPQKAKG